MNGIIASLHCPNKQTDPAYTKSWTQCSSAAPLHTENRLAHQESKCFIPYEPRYLHPCGPIHEAEEHHRSVGIKSTIKRHASTGSLHARARHGSPITTSTTMCTERQGTHGSSHGMPLQESTSNKNTLKRQGSTGSVRELARHECTGGVMEGITKCYSHHHVARAR